MAAAAATSSMVPTSAPPQPIPIQTQAQVEQRTELPRPYKCTMCDKAFHRLEHQTRHIRTHTGEKPHACNFPGCTKKFSRSDELTRHTRIHNNPNSRRGKQHTHQAAVAAVMGSGHLPEHQGMAHIMGPPLISSTYSAPNSEVSSPNISPPHSYNQHMAQHSTPYGSFNGNGPSPESGYYQNHTQYAPSMNILAHAASRAAEVEKIGAYPPPMQQPFTHPYHRSNQQPDQHLFSARNDLAAYHYSSQPNSQPPSHPMSRTHSDEDQQHAHRAKRSRPGSPFSTNPPSPTFSSTDSISPTPGHTPAMTPGHSPRMRAHKHPSDCHLPGIRSLSLAHLHSPALEPLEPSTQASGSTTPHHPYSRSQNNSSAGLRIADIMNRSDGTQRKLPVPSLPGADLGLPSLRDSGHDRMEF